MSGLRDMIREMLRDEVRAAIREELAGSNGKAEVLPIAAPVTFQQLGGNPDQAIPPAPSPKRRQRVGKRDLWVGDVVNGRTIVKLAGRSEKDNRVLVRVRCNGCGREDKIGAESAVSNGCKRCATTSRPGFVEGSRAKLGEMSRMVGVALGEILLATVTTPVLVGATALRARIPVAEWQRITGQDKVPDARVIGRGLGTLAVAPPPGLLVSLARGKGAKGPAQWRVERVAARMP